MRTLFSKRGLRIGVLLSETNTILLTIDSDYSNSPRKSLLYINPDRLAEKVKDFYRALKTKTTKLKSVETYFHEIDWYDNMTDIYKTPAVSMSKGQKIPRINYRTHGCIPKDWGVVLIVEFEPLKQKKPITEATKLAIGSLLGLSEMKRFEKKLTKLMSGELPHNRFEIFFYDDE